MAVSRARLDSAGRDGEGRDGDGAGRDGSRGSGASMKGSVGRCSGGGWERVHSAPSRLGPPPGAHHYLMMSLIVRA